jgi:hypothetical protein
MGRPQLSSVVARALGVAVVLMFAAWWWGRSDLVEVILPLVAAVVISLVSLRLLVDVAPTRICPNCQAESIRRRAISPFGFRYYECASCGLRAKRRPFEDWEDASNPRDDARFRKRSRKSDSVPVDQTGTRYEGSLTGTQGELLAHKRLRRPPDDQRLISDQPPARDP